MLRIFFLKYLSSDCNEDNESNFDQYANGIEYMNSLGNINTHN